MTNQPITVSSLGATPYVEQGYSLNGAGEPIGLLMILVFFVVMIFAVTKDSYKDAIWALAASLAISAWLGLAASLVAGLVRL